MKLPEQVLTTDIRASDATYTILVNAVPLLTPKGHAVSVHSWDLANALADELIAEGTIDLQHVTLYSLYATQRDFIEDRLEGTIGAILQHLPGDFVLHPDADPSLAAQQLAAWAPLLAFLRALGPEVPIARPLHEPQIPWELTEALRAQLAAMNAAQLTVVLQAVTNLGSVTLGIRLAQQAVAVDQAVAALTVTANYAAPGARGADIEQHTIVAEVRQILRCMLQYVALSGTYPS
jgi:chaperone required for assembly of F1-ATPase